MAITNIPLHHGVILRGVDGRLLKENGDFLAHVPRWRMWVTITNADVPRAGYMVDAVVLMSFRVNLTMEETIISDDYVSDIIGQLAQGYQPEFGFQGRVEGRTDKQGNGIYIFRSCVPDGDVDLVNVTPGQQLTRPLTFRSNQPPEISQGLATPL